MEDAIGQFLNTVAAQWWLWAAVAVILGDQALRAASAGYRREMVRVLTRRAIVEAHRQAKGEI